MVLGAAIVAGCATTPTWPDAPLSVVGHPLPPYQIHEECAVLAAGDRLEFAFESSEPVSRARKTCFLRKEGLPPPS